MAVISFERIGDIKSSLNLGRKAMIIKLLDDLNISSKYYFISSYYEIIVICNLNLINIGTNIKLPDNLTIYGNLRLTDTKITELPNNLKVNDSLYLNGTNIYELPKDLIVFGPLILSNTKIVKIPSSIKILDSIIVNHKQTELIEFIKTTEWHNKILYEF